MMRPLPKNRQIRSYLIILLFGSVMMVMSPWIFRHRISMDLNRLSSPLESTLIESKLRYRRRSCSCSRPILSSKSIDLVIDETVTSLCSQYSTLRGPGQRIVTISMYGPRENRRFSLNQSLNFLHELIDEMHNIYPNWILRIYHDNSISDDIVCSFECENDQVDFCNVSTFGHLTNIATFVPPKIWRFLPVGDPFAEIVASRDLDSPLAARELAAVNEWLSSGKTWHVMRDHPLHTVPILGGMWGFRRTSNENLSRILFEKILDPTLIVNFTGRADQTFLGEHVWPYIQDDVLVHDSHLCETNYGRNARPWPTKRPELNATGCFVGCIRPCCQILLHPFGECPLACRPTDHKDWTMC